MITERRHHGVPVSGDDVRTFGLRLFNHWHGDLPPEERDLFQLQRPVRLAFTASDGWLRGFLRRWRLTYRRSTTDSTTVPVNAAELVNEFRQGVHRTIQENGIQLTVNMDETFALFDMAPRYTYATKGSRQVDIRTSRGNPKMGCTITLGITTCGRKMPATVTFQGLAPDGPEVAELTQDAPENVRVTGSRTGWANWQTLLTWVRECLFPFVENAFPFLLIWDRFPAHRNRQVCDVVEDAPGFIELIPGRCTSLVQPLDLTIIRSFKSSMRNLWKAWKIGANDEDGRSERITRRTLLRIVGHAWERISPEAINIAWRTSGLLPNQEPLMADNQEVIENDDDDEGILFLDEDDLENY